MLPECIGELEGLYPWVGTVQRPEDVEGVVAISIGGEDDLVLAGDGLKHRGKPRHELRNVVCLVPDGHDDGQQAHGAPVRRAGLPTTTVLAPTSRVTTAPAPTIASSPT